MPTTMTKGGVRRTYSTSLPIRQAVQRRKARDTAYLRALRAETRCIRCGAQPVEFHHDDHPEHPTRRVGFLAHRGASLRRIQAEIARCEALCRRCHMLVDGRIGQSRKEPRPCTQCGRPMMAVTRRICVNCAASNRYYRRKERPATSSSVSPHERKP